MDSAIQQTGSSVAGSLQDLYNKVAAFLPQLVAAIIILIIGWIIAVLLGNGVTRVLHFIKVDSLADRFGLHQLGERIGRKVTVSGLFGWLVKWFFLIATFVAAAEALGLNQVSQFLYNEVFPYFGNVVVAAIILVIGYLVAHFLYEVIRDSLKASGFAAATTVAAAGRWAILIFSFIAALAQLKIAPDFMKLLFTAIVFMLALAGGLAFGLGGRDQARDMLEQIRNKSRPAK
ncbi:MAG: hypothetical protein M1383_01395 [Patescibacteria group bacterium]|nr:hypothetical protein [Patescibacteria group bacterium]